jgi:ribonuclease HI
MEVKAMKAKDNGETIRVFTDGSGQAPNGKSSAMAWYRIDTGERHVERVPGLTNNQAEYGAVISALKAFGSDLSIGVLTDSLLMVSRLRGEFRILDPKLATLAAEVKTITEQKRLSLKLTWVPRSKNLAGMLL